MKHDQSTPSPFIPVKPTHPTTLICSMKNTNTALGIMEHHITAYGPCIIYQHICSDYRGVLSLFCLWIFAVRYRLSWAWHTCPPSYRLSYFLFKIYMENGNAKTVCINILFYPMVVLLSIRWLSICICVKNSKRCHFEKWLKC